MRFPGAVRMAEGVSAPIWARTNRGGGGAFGAFFSFLVFVLALLGALSLVMAVMNHMSFAQGGAKIDHWIAPVVGKMGGGEKAADQPATATAPASAPAASAPASAAPAGK